MFSLSLVSVAEASSIEGVELTLINSLSFGVTLTSLEILIVEGACSQAPAVAILPPTWTYVNTLDTKS